VIEKPTKKQRAAQGASPCVPMSAHWEKGDQMEVVEVRDGHVLVWPSGPKAPPMSYLICLSCGAPHHKLFPTK
jgi:hypothetical protein